MSPDPTFLEPHFHSVSWGMTKDEVKALETATQVSKNPDDLIYSVKVQQKDAILQYEFNDDGQLFRAGYIFRPNYLNFNEYVKDFNQLEAAYLDKYKEPSIERTENGQIRSLKAARKASALPLPWATAKFSQSGRRTTRS